MQIGRRARVDRTENMKFMPLASDVSKLTGWLNADALYQVETGGIRSGARCGPGCWRAAGNRSACNAVHSSSVQGRGSAGNGGQGRGGAHVEHEFHA